MQIEQQEPYTILWGNVKPPSQNYQCGCEWFMGYPLYKKCGCRFFLNWAVVEKWFLWGFGILKVQDEWGEARYNSRVCCCCVPACCLGVGRWSQKKRKCFLDLIFAPERNWVLEGNFGTLQTHPHRLRDFELFWEIHVTIVVNRPSRNPTLAVATLGAWNSLGH